MNNDPSLLRKLEQKVTQERELTEERTEKWKEAAKILKEQSALALKQVREKCLSFVACQLSMHRTSHYELCHSAAF